MSMAMDRIESYGFERGGRSIFTADPPPPEKRGRTVAGGGTDPESGSWLSLPSVSSVSSSSSASSSIGRNSDDEEDDGGKASLDDGDSGENEAESPYKGSLDMMDSLEEVLPIRRGISKFYNGKSKSFTSVVEASSAAKDISKPDNPYSRRRRNLLSHHLWENKNRSSRGGISKRPIALGSSKSSLALAMAEMTGSGEDSSSGSSPTTSASPPTSTLTLPPLHPRSKGSFGNLMSPPSPGLCAWRSYSVVDLPRCFPAVGGGTGDS